MTIRTSVNWEFVHRSDASDAELAKAAWEAFESDRLPALKQLYVEGRLIELAGEILDIFDSFVIDMPVT